MCAVCLGQSVRSNVMCIVHEMCLHEALVHLNRNLDTYCLLFLNKK